MICPQCKKNTLIISGTDILARERKASCLACGFWCWLKYLKKIANKLDKKIFNN